MNAPPEPTCLAFSLIADYAILKGWVPIGVRTFTVGPWRITLNGTKTKDGDVLPFHAVVEHTETIALMVMSPYGGSAGGWKDTEDTFIRDMQAAIAAQKAAS